MKTAPRQFLPPLAVVLVIFGATDYILSAQTGARALSDADMKHLTGGSWNGNCVNVENCTGSGSCTMSGDAGCVGTGHACSQDASYTTAATPRSCSSSGQNSPCYAAPSDTAVNEKCTATVNCSCKQSPPMSGTYKCYAQPPTNWQGTTGCYKLGDCSGGSNMSACN